MEPEKVRESAAFIRGPRGQSCGRFPWCPILLQPRGQARPCCGPTALTAGHSAVAGGVEPGTEADGRNCRVFALSSLFRNL